MGSYLEEFKLKWDKRHDGDPYCEWCLDSTPLEDLKDIDEYKCCDTCFPKAQKEWTKYEQWLDKQRAENV